MKNNVITIGLIICIIVSIIAFATRRFLLLRFFAFTHGNRSCSFSHCSTYEAYGSKKLALEFEIKRPKEILKDSLQLKKALEEFLSDHASLYKDYIIECEFKTDSANAYIKLSNQTDISSNSLENLNVLSYGEFNGTLGDTKYFQDTTMFEELKFVGYQYLDCSSLDSQTELKSIQLIGCDKIKEEAIKYLTIHHPNCNIQYKY